MCVKFSTHPTNYAIGKSKKIIPPLCLTFFDFTTRFCLIPSLLHLGTVTGCGLAYIGSLASATNKQLNIGLLRWLDAVKFHIKTNSRI